MKLTNETKQKLALAMHRQNPTVVSVESASRDIDRMLAEVIKRGRETEDGWYSISTAGYRFEYHRDVEMGDFEDVEVLIDLITLYEDGDHFEWGLMDTLVENWKA